MAALSVEVELRDRPTTPVYQRIAAEAAVMQDRGVTVAAIARHFAVGDHTAAKAILWFRER